VKRFWKQASVVVQDGAARIVLDGKPMRVPEGRLPGGAALSLPPGALADAIADEWQSAGGDVGGTVVPEDLPLTRLAATAFQKIAPTPGPTIDAIARYGETDLLCYRAVAPLELAARQALLWQPWLDWADARYGARLAAQAGVMPFAQTPHALARLHEAVAACTPCRLAGLGIIVPALGSLVLGLALAEGRLEPATAHELALLDELFETGQWGADAAAEARRANILQDVSDASRFMALAGG
jgi:chaperone required for assembly of F1-ATPase